MHISLIRHGKILSLEQCQGQCDDHCIVYFDCGCDFDCNDDCDFDFNSHLDFDLVAKERLYSLFYLFCKAITLWTPDLYFF